uniref:Uncharacterized protein n=1 Tax=Arundo donax TaxID=35708 RepID=A0A0A9BWH3_ARUDO
MHLWFSSTTKKKTLARTMLWFKLSLNLG